MIIHNGLEVDTENTDVLLEKWKYKEVYGDVQPEKPDYCLYRNIAKAIQMIMKHVKNNSKIALHTDVDMDGIGSTYIMKKSLEYLGNYNHLLLINKEKVHGIQQKYADYFNANPIIDLIIITDSSSNELDIIKQFKCDVLVIDHHEIEHNELSGKCNDGVHDFVIVNNTIDNVGSTAVEDLELLKSINPKAFKDNEFTEYKGTKAMSCGLVVYEIMRVYSKLVEKDLLLENLMLYQWAGLTLFTDVIDTLNPRNQWYLEKTVFSNSTESTLGKMLNSLNRFKASLDKSTIQYTIAPVVNKAIRAGKSSEALGIVVNTPHNAEQLKEYAVEQQRAITKALEIEYTNPVTGLKSRAKRVFDTDNICFDAGKLGIDPNYFGVIASKLSGDLHKNVAVYQSTENGIDNIHFRGKMKEVDYRSYFNNFGNGVKAQGHTGAFGITANLEQLQYLMNNIHTIEENVDNRPYFSLGDMDEAHRGKYHITDIDEFKRQGYVWKIATGNARVNSSDEIFIRIKASDLEFVGASESGSLLYYKAFGFNCKAFAQPTTEYVDLYIEFSNEVNVFVRET